MPEASHRLPARWLPLAAGVAARRRLINEWAAIRPSTWLPAPADLGLGGSPRDLRPADIKAGQRILAGGFGLAGLTVETGARGDPWDRASPSRGFAVSLHRFDWLTDLLACGRPGAAEALRLLLAWRRQHGRPAGFAWTPEVMERRVFNLACGLRVICAGASEAETSALARTLLAQAQRLFASDDGRPRAAERACVVAVAASALSGRRAQRLKVRALARLARALPQTVLADGGHASRSPEAGLDLLFDLFTLDEALTERGHAAPPAMMQAIDRLLGAVRFFTLSDGRLPAVQGGRSPAAALVAAARAEDEWADRRAPMALGGYHRVGALKGLEIFADAAPPAAGAWSATACAQPLSLEILAGGRPLIGGQAWSEGAAPAALRMVEAASTLALGDEGCGAPVGGLAGRAFGPRLRDARYLVRADRREADGAVWLDMTHDGWARRLALRCERRLYLDAAGEELRAEDRFTALGTRRRDQGHFIPYAIRFHLHPGVSALAARDGKSVLIKPEGQEQGWLLRTDAQDVHLEPSLRFLGPGEVRRTQQIVLRGQVRIEQGARVRWKLSPAEPQR